MNTPTPPTAEIERIRELAEKATPGPWRSRGLGGDSIVLVPKHRWHSAYPMEGEGYPIAVPRTYQMPTGENGHMETRVDYSSAGFSHEDAAYIAAVSPDVVLGLLSALTAKDRELAEAKAEAAALLDATKNLIHRASMLGLNSRTPEFLSPHKTVVDLSSLESLRTASGLTQEAIANIAPLATALLSEHEALKKRVVELEAHITLHDGLGSVCLVCRGSSKACPLASAVHIQIGKRRNNLVTR